MQMPAIELFEQCKALAIRLRADVAAGLVRKQIADRRLGSGINDRARVLGRQKRGVPVLRAI